MAATIRVKKTRSHGRQMRCHHGHAGRYDCLGLCGGQNLLFSIQIQISHIGARKLSWHSSYKYHWTEKNCTKSVQHIVP